MSIKYEDASVSRSSFTKVKNSVSLKLNMNILLPYLIFNSRCDYKIYFLIIIYL